MADISDTTLRAQLQRHADTIESLTAAGNKLRTRCNALEQQLTVKQAELDSLRLLSTENSTLREELFNANERNRELEQAVSRLTEQSTLGAESQAQLGVKVQAYQRHNSFLQGELATSEGKLAVARERIDVLQNEVRHKEQRVSILIEKLRQHNIDPSASSLKVNLTEEAYREMRDKIASQAASIDLLREKVESMQEEAVRREELVGALRRENDALKGTVSRLIALSSGTMLHATADAADNKTNTNSPNPRRSASAEDNVAADRLAAFKRQKQASARNALADGNVVSP